MPRAERRSPRSPGRAAEELHPAQSGAVPPALLLLSDTPVGDGEIPDWAKTARQVSPQPGPVGRALAQVLDQPGADSVLCWAVRLGPVPPLAVLLGLLNDPGIDVAHGGLALGLAGLPRRHACIAPTWMHTLDPSPERPGTSWRVSLEAALIRASVLAQPGGIDPRFDTLAGAGLEAGHRWIRSGALVSSQPGLLTHLSAESGFTGTPLSASPPSGADEVRFLLRRTSRVWAGFALATKPPRPKLWAQLPKLLAEPSVASEVLTDRGHVLSPETAVSPVSAVSVLIPTIDRSPWLRVVLDQLRTQTIAPHQVIVIDQSGPKHLDPDIAADFADLPLDYRTQAAEGQSTARNEGLRAVTGDVVLFLDDDDEIEPDLIERHLATLNRFRADVCSGVADEPSSGELPHDFTYLRASDVLGTNNATVRRSVLAEVGGFDLAFDHGPRADLDLGIRLHLAGARMVLDPSIRVLHHRAPRGGLRTFDARRVTRGSSRQSIFATVPTAATELYLWHHHFGPVRRRQAERIRLLSALSGSGSTPRRAARFMVQAAKLVTDRGRRRAGATGADALLRAHPTIDRPLPPPAS